MERPSASPPYIDRWATFDSGYNSFRANEQGVLKQINQYSTNYIRDKAVAFLQESEANDSQPWFLYLAPYAPHLPAVPETQYEDAPIPAWDPNPAVLESDLTDKPPWVAFSRIDHRRDDRGPGQHAADADLGGQHGRHRDADAVQANGETNTLAIFTSDNGYMWGEHNLEAKNRPYLDSVRVPMYMRWPGEVRGGRDRQPPGRPTSTWRRPPWPRPGLTSAAEMDGRDLLDNTWSRDRMLTEFNFQGDVPTWVSLLTHTSHYIENYRKDADLFSPTFREYYDLTNDPYELEQPARRRQLRRTIRRSRRSRRRSADDRVCAGSNCP